MEPSDLIPMLLSFILAAVVFGVPVLALSVRFALKPLVEAYARLKDVHEREPQGMPLLKERVALLEQRLLSVEGDVERLGEVTEFHRELQKPAR